MNNVSFCVVTHNNSNTILNLLKSIYNDFDNLEITVFVVDNSSTDNTVELIKDNYPDVILIENNVNKGFGYANNLVLNKLNSKFHIIINPDISFEKGIIKELANYLNLHKEVVIITPKILNEDKTEQHLPKKNPQFKYLLAGRLEKFFPSLKKLRSKYTMSENINNEPFNIEFCTGCFMMVRTEIFKILNGFDDRFFMYFEDADLSRRARQYGKIIFYPKVSIMHLWERASSKKLKFLFIHISSMIKYFNKWKGRI